jgi:hypothetical protein
MHPPPEKIGGCVGTSVSLDALKEEKKYHPTAVENQTKIPWLFNPQSRYCTDHAIPANMTLPHVPEKKYHLSSNKNNIQKTKKTKPDDHQLFLDTDTHRTCGGYSKWQVVHVLNQPAKVKPHWESYSSRILTICWTFNHIRSTLPMHKITTGDLSLGSLQCAD